MSRIFVYGTLRSGGAANRMLAAERALGPATVAGMLYDVGGRYPALVLEGDGAVHGEVWSCDEGLLRTLDEYEGVEQGLFRRVSLPVDGEMCWAYVAGPLLADALIPAARIAGGEWTGRAR